MGRLTISEAQALIDAGVLNDNALHELQSRGLVGTRRRRKEKDYVLNTNGDRVYPSLTFQGHGKGNKDSQVMQNIRSEFQIIIDKHKENK